MCFARRILGRRGRAKTQYNFVKQFINIVVYELSNEQRCIGNAAHSVILRGLTLT